MNKVTQCHLCGNSNLKTIQLIKEKTLLWCKKCDFGFRLAKRSKSENNQFYAEDYYNSHKLNFDHNRVSVYKKEFKICEDNTNTGSLLDFGCGLGHFLKYAQDRGWKAMGTDISPQAVEIAQKEFGVNAQCRDIDQLAKDNLKFDVITLWNVLDQLYDANQTLLSLKSILAPQGKIVIRIFNFSSRRLIYWLGQKMKSKFLIANFGFFQEVAFSPKSIKKLLSECGYNNIIIRNSVIAGDVKGKKSNIFLFVNFLATLIYNLSFGKVCLSPSLFIIAHNS